MIIKSKQYKAGEFYIAPKSTVEDITLSWKAKGLLSYLLSRPPDWQISTSELIKRSTDGEAALRSGLVELERAGYLVRKRENDPQTGFIRWVAIVQDTPLPSDKRSSPDDRKLTEAEPSSENHQMDDQPSSENHQMDNQPSSENHQMDDQPSSENPQVDKPQVENHQGTNNDLTNNDWTENEEAGEEVEAGARTENGACAPQPPPPPFLPNQFELSVASLKQTAFTPEQCQAILAAEQSRGAAARVTLIRHMCQRLSEPPPAVKVFHATMGRYPPRNTWQSIAERIGDAERDLDLWHELLEAWKLSSRNQTNYGWILDCFDRGEIPGRKERRRATGERDYTQYANTDLPPREEPERTEAEKLWDSALHELELQMTRATFDAWLRGTRATGIKNGADGELVPVLEVEVKNTYAVEWLENRLYTLIERTLKRLTDTVGRVEFIAPDDAPPSASISQEILETNEVPAQ